MDTENVSVTEEVPQVEEVPADWKDFLVCVIVDASRKKPQVYTVTENYKTATYKNKKGEDVPLVPINSVHKSYWSVKAPNEYWALKAALNKFKENRVRG